MIKFFSKNPILDKEQKLVLKSKPNTIIQGCAGSGKTQLVLLLSKKLSAKNNSIAILVYTKALKSFMEQELQSLKVKNIDIYYQNEWNHFNRLKYDFIIIDEAQDFALNEIAEFQKSAKIGVYIFGDDNQQVYENYNGRKNTSISELSTHFKFPLISLKNNYRISNTIAQLINSIYEVDLTNHRFQGSYKPKFVRLNSPVQEMEFISNYVKENPNENIGILLLENKSLKNSYLFNGNTKSINIPGIIETKDFLVNKGIKVGYKFNFANMLNFEDEYNVNIMTYHSSKGIQFDTVILPFLNHSYHDSNSKVNYVGMTRAKSKLLITYTDLLNSEYCKDFDKNKIDGEIRCFDESKDHNKAMLEAIRLMNDLGI